MHHSKKNPWALCVQPTSVRTIPGPRYESFCDAQNVSCPHHNKICFSCFFLNQNSDNRGHNLCSIWHWYFSPLIYIGIGICWGLYFLVLIFFGIGILWHWSVWNAQIFIIIIFNYTTAKFGFEFCVLSHRSHRFKHI